MLAEGSFDDPENARVILLAAGGLVLLAVLVGAGTLWWWRSVKVEHPALGPLEVMGTRSWWKGDYTSRRRRLEDARPVGAEPIDAVPASSDDPVDLEAAALASPPEFDDLLDVPLSGEGAVAVAGAVDDAVAVGAAASSIDDVPAGGAPVDGAPGDGVMPDASIADAAAVAVEPGEGTSAEPAAPAAVAVGAHAAVAERVAVAQPGADDTSVSAEVPRPIDPLLRMQQSE